MPTSPVNTYVYMLQYSRDAVLHEPHGIRWGRRAANFDPTQAVSCKHSNRQCHPRYKPANLRSGCSSQSRAVRFSPCGAMSKQPAVQSLLSCTGAKLKVLSSVLDMVACSLVVVLERRTLVHDLKTLELLRTLETPSNPKVPTKHTMGTAVCLVTIMSLCISQS